MFFIALFEEHLQCVLYANRKRLLLTPGPVPFGTCKYSSLSNTCHIPGYWNITRFFYFTYLICLDCVISRLIWRLDCLVNPEGGNINFRFCSRSTRFWIVICFLKDVRNNTSIFRIYDCKINALCTGYDTCKCTYLGKKCILKVFSNTCELDILLNL